MTIEPADSTEPTIVDLSTRLLPREVEIIRRAIKTTMGQADPQRPGKTIGTAKTGIYAFYDYDGEPIYVGQTAEGFNARVGRHLRDMRTDAVGHFVLDPYEVRTIRMWSLPEIYDNYDKDHRRAALAPYEYTVYVKLRDESTFKALLNEADIAPLEFQSLPEPVTGVIIPDEIYADRSHPDTRIARRSLTVSLLAKNISERQVSMGLRRTLVTQTRRLQLLAEKRYEGLGGDLAEAAEQNYEAN